MSIPSKPKPAPVKNGYSEPASANGQTLAAPTPYIMLGEIPIPASKRGGFGQPKYPWSQLQIGQSFFVPGQTVKKFSGLASATARRMQVKFVVRDLVHEGVAGVGVWRVEGAVTPRARAPKAPVAQPAPAPAEMAA